METKEGGERRQRQLWDLFSAGTQRALFERLRLEQCHSTIKRKVDSRFEKINKSGTLDRKNRALLPETVTAENGCSCCSESRVGGRPIDTEMRRVTCGVIFQH
jgi:hypothetical protein